MVVLEVLPEPLAQVIGEGLQGRVVQSGLSFPQVVHQQVADWPAGEAVAADQPGGGELAGGAELPQPGGRLLSEGPHLVQQPVEHGAVRRRGAGAGLGAEDFQDVAGGDIGDRASFGREDQGGPAQGHVRGGFRDPRIAGAQFPHPGEPCRVTGPGQVAAKGAFAGQAGHQPAH